MKRYLFALALLTAGPAMGQMKDPTLWPYTGNPYRHRTAVVDSSGRIMYKANVLGLQTGETPAKAYEIALKCLRDNGYILAYSNPDSLLFTTRAKPLAAWASASTGVAVWGRVLPNGLVLFYPFFYNSNQQFPFWGGDGKVNSFTSTLAYDTFREAEQAARSWAGLSGKLRYYRMKP